LLIALGVVAPLWEHAGAYVFSFVALGMPGLFYWLLRRPEASARRMAVLGALAVASLPYLGIWLYAVVLLSRLSLPLVLVVGLAGGSALALGRRTALRAGIAEQRLLKAARTAGTTLAALAGIGVVVMMAMMASMIAFSESITFDEPPVSAPLEKARVTRRGGATSEVFATLAAGVQLEGAVNLALFEGFDARMTREEAEQRLGPATGRWTDPAFSLPATYYDRPDGRISLVRQGASAWSTVGHPSTCTNDYVFRDPRLREQILAWLPPQGTVQVNVLRRSAGGGSLSS
jgi:hypothetical protein